MRLILLLLQVWGGLHISLSQNVTCSQPPQIDHAQVSDSSKKSLYHQDDVVYFTCDHGYISGPAIRYTCTARGWEVLHKGKCYLKPCMLPEETPNGYYQIIHGEDFVFGTVIKYYCNEGYYMASRADTRTCLLDRWTNHVPVCEPFKCELPPADGEVVVKGLPDNEQAVLPDRFLRFSCKAPGKSLSGSSMLICGKDGQWDNAFPTCEDITCDAEEMHNNLRVAGLPQANGKMKIGHQLQFECTNGFMLDGQEQVTCLESGQWDAPFPTCSEICRITNIPSSVGFYSPTGKREVRKGQKVTFGCKRPETYIRGNVDVECLDNGQWSHSFPTCGDPLPCGKPPALESGDLREGLQFEYLHGERVEYICQNLYVMEGLTHRICQNGEWIGAVKCLKPCIITVDDMRQRNIALKHKNPQKQYTPHNDRLEFTCSYGRLARREDRNMIRYCRDGVMVLPTCY